MKRAVLYARLSGDDRPNDGRNLVSQIDMCREYAQKKGWKVVGELSEDEGGASGTDLYLPQLQRIIDMAADRRFDLLVVREIDRLSRRFAKQILIEEILNKAGVKIEYVLGDYPDTADGLLLKNIRTVIAEYEREKIVERVMRGKEALIKAGNVSTGKLAPYGYAYRRVEGKRSLVIDEEEAEVVRLIFKSYLLGDENGKSLSGSQIAKHLDNLNIRTPLMRAGHCHPTSRINKKWSRMCINKILNTETYAGKWHWRKRQSTRDGQRIKVNTSKLLYVNVPAIIDREQWNAVQIKKENIRLRRLESLNEFLLHHLLYCGNCGSTISIRRYKAKNGKWRRYYVCHRAVNYRDRCSNYRCFPQTWLDHTVYAWVESQLSSSSILDRGRIIETSMTNDSISTTIEEIERKIRNEYLLISNKLSLYLDGEISSESLIQKKNELEANILELENERNMYRNKHKVRLSDSQQLLYYNFSSLSVGEMLEEGKTNFAIGRKIIERVDIRGELLEGDGNLIAKITSNIGEESFKRRIRVEYNEPYQTHTR